MQSFTVRFAHLSEPPRLKPNQWVRRGDVIGKMGNTGYSAGAHLHIDLVNNCVPYCYRLSNITFNRDTIKQLNYFIDDELFDHAIHITTAFADPFYKDGQGYPKLHPAYDVVPLDRHESQAHWWIHWNRSAKGKVLIVDHDPAYGNFINICFNV